MAPVPPLQAEPPHPEFAPVNTMTAAAPEGEASPATLLTLAAAAAAAAPLAAAVGAATVATTAATAAAVGAELLGVETRDTPRQEEELRRTRRRAVRRRSDLTGGADVPASGGGHPRGRDRPRPGLADHHAMEQPLGGPFAEPARDGAARPFGRLCPARRRRSGRGSSSRRCASTACRRTYQRCSAAPRLCGGPAGGRFGDRLGLSAAPRDALRCEAPT